MSTLEPVRPLNLDLPIKLEQKTIRLAAMTDRIANQWHLEQRQPICPNCGNKLSFYTQVQGKTLVCFVCRKASITRFPEVLRQDLLSS